jgi:hypothetical protein
MTKNTGAKGIAKKKRQDQMTRKEQIGRNTRVHELAPHPVVYMSAGMIEQLRAKKPKGPKQKKAK